MGCLGSRCECSSLKTLRFLAYSFIMIDSSISLAVSWALCIMCSCVRSSRDVVDSIFFFFFQAEDGIRDLTVTGVQTCAIPIFHGLRDGLGQRSAVADAGGE